MPSFGQIIFGLILAAIGAVITIKAEWLYQNFGSIPSFDKWLGTEGGSRLGYKLIGILTSVIGFMVMTNLIQGVFRGLGQLFFLR